MVHIGRKVGTPKKGGFIMAKKESKYQVLDELVQSMDKQFGKGTLMRIGEKPSDAFPVFSSGSLSLDMALGIGGIPKGRIVEVFGPESSGKTTLCLEMVAQVQKAGGVAAFVDAEHALDVRYAAKVGVKVEELLVCQPDCGEQALEVVESLIRSGACDLVVVDSVAALVPKAEIEGEMGDAHVGLQARLMSQALRKIVGACHKHECTVVFVNQLRQKIGVMFGNPETTTGGNALKFYASIRLEVRRVASQKNGKEANGNRVRVKVVKNKLAPPYTEAEFDIIFGEGVDKVGDILETAERLGVIERSGSWLSFNGEQLGQGREAVSQKLAEDAGIFGEVERRVRERLCLGAPQAV
jgi:recombination protein RecA